MFVALETTCPRIELREFDIDMDSTYIYIYMVPPLKSLPFSWAKEVAYIYSIYIYIFFLMFWKFRFCFGRKGV